MRNFVVRRWFLILLSLVLAVGVVFAPQLKRLADAAALRYSIVAAVLFLMALPVQAQAMWNALRRPTAPILAVVVNFGFLPLLAWGVSSALTPLLLDENTARGILVAATAPCTLASAAVWTRRAGGNDAVAIMVTIITNLTCFLITPGWLIWMTGQLPHITPAGMISKLGLVVVLPMVVAQLLRRVSPRLAVAATRHKIPLGVTAQFGILTMILMGAIQTGLRLRDSGNRMYVSEAVAMVLTVLAIHLLALLAGFVVARLVRLPREDQIAVGISGSQKTLMVGLQVGIELRITILPIVVYHIGQLLLDTFIADRLRAAGERK